MCLSRILSFAAIPRYIEIQVTYSEQTIGRACSHVNLARHKQSGAPNAIKMFNVYDRSQSWQLFQEISIMASLQDFYALISLMGRRYVDWDEIGSICMYRSCDIEGPLLG